MKLKNKTAKILHQKGRLKEYKEIFSYKQTRFMLTKIINILNPNADPIKTSELEISIIKNNDNMFVPAAKKITSIAHTKKYEKADWESFGKYLYFVFQTGVFYKNKKTQTPNIYDGGNYIELNIEKKILFNKFVDSLKIISPDHNTLIKKILKVVL